MKQDYRRRIKKTRFINAGVVILALGVIVTVFVSGLYWGRHIQQARKAASLAAPEADVRTVHLAFPGGKRLGFETRELPKRPARLSLAEDLVGELLKGPGSTELDRISPPDTELKALFMDGAGVVFIDVNRHALTLPKDVMGEYLAVQSFFETLRRNIPEVTAVKFLVDSKEVDTLWGHLDASFPWSQEYVE